MQTHKTELKEDIKQDVDEQKWTTYVMGWIIEKSILLQPAGHIQKFVQSYHFSRTRN